MNTFTGNFYDAYKNNLLQFQSSEATLTQCAATYFPTGSPLVVVGDHTGSDAGSDSDGDPMPASIACCISWQSGVYWRGGKPRTYLAGLQDDVIVSPQFWNSTFRTNLATGADAFLSAVNALASGNFDSIQLGLVSFMSGGVARTPPLFFPFVGASVHPRIDSQRRRLGKAV